MKLELIYYNKINFYLALNYFFAEKNVNFEKFYTKNQHSRRKLK